MGYRVDLSPRAKSDVDKIFSKVIHEAPFQGALWCDRFEQSILSLQEMPERCTGGAAPFDTAASRTVVLFGKRRHAYRVYFTIVKDTVQVIHIRHGARKELKRL